MKKKMSIWLAALLCAMMVLGCAAAPEVTGTAAPEAKLPAPQAVKAPEAGTDAAEFSWVIQGDYCRITGYKGNSTTPVIPEVVGDRQVRKIDINAFKGRGLTDVTIPGSVTEIGEGAFADNQLTSLVIPASLEYIWQNAFANNRLTSFVIPAGVTIREGAFAGNALTSLSLPAGVYIGDNAFANNQLTSLVIAAGVENIREGAFAGNMLTSLSLPEGLKYIGKNAFAGNRISGLNVPAGVYIGENAFADNQIRELVIGKDVAWAKGAFANNGMTSLTVEQTNRVAVENAFAGNALTSLTLPENFVGAQKNFPMELMKYYYSSAQEAGTYSLQNGKCFHNGKEMSEPAAITVDPGVSIRISSKSSGGYYYGFSIEGVGLMYYLAPGTYSVAASYDKIDGNMRTTSERHVTLDNQNFGSGKTYRVKAALNRIYEQVSYSIDELQ